MELIFHLIVQVKLVIIETLSRTMYLFIITYVKLLKYASSTVKKLTTTTSKTKTTTTTTTTITIIILIIMIMT